MASKDSSPTNPTDLPAGPPTFVPAAAGTPAPPEAPMPAYLAAPTTRADPARPWQIAFAIAGVVALALAVATALLALRPPAPAPAPPTVTTTATTTVTTTSTVTATPTTTPTSATPTTTPPPLYLTHYVAVNPTGLKPNAIIIEIHTDYQCPWCQRAEQVYGDALAQLSQSGDIDLRMHLRTIIGDNLIKNDSSERASIAALCADKVGAFWSYHSAVFANQPSEGVGYTDDQLRSTFATQAGITGANLTTFQTCYDTKATSADVTAMEQEGAQAGISGTPTFYVEGQKVNFNLQTTTPIDANGLLSGLNQLLGRS